MYKTYGISAVALADVTSPPPGPIGRATVRSNEQNCYFLPCSHISILYSFGRYVDCSNALRGLGAV
jgi:hypothetical protein